MGILAKIRSLKIRLIAYKNAKKEIITVYMKNGGGKEPELPDGVRYLKATTAQEYVSLITKYDVDLSEHLVSRFQKNDYFYCLINDNEIITSGWVSNCEYFWIAETDIVVKKENGYNIGILYDFVTKAQYRGYGYYGLLLNTMITDLDNEKYVIYAKRGNVASCNGISKAGFTHLGSISYDMNECNRLLRPLGLTAVGRHYKYCGFYYNVFDN